MSASPSCEAFISAVSPICVMADMYDIFFVRCWQCQKVSTQLIAGVNTETWDFPPPNNQNDYIKRLRINTFTMLQKL